MEIFQEAVVNQSVKDESECVMGNEPKHVMESHIIKEEREKDHMSPLEMKPKGETVICEIKEEAQDSSNVREANVDEVRETLLDSFPTSRFSLEIKNEITYLEERNLSIESSILPGTGSESEDPHCRQENAEILTEDTNIVVDNIAYAACNMSEKNQNSKNELNIQNHVSTPVPFSCNICGKPIPDKTCFRRHMRSHTRPFSCEICNKTFTQKSSLNTHLMLLHGDGQLCTCEICNKVFSHPSRLKKHMHNHRDDRIFSCDICKKTFSAKKSLRIHFRSHTGERPYTCSICRRTFINVGHLNIHMRRNHTVLRPYSCEICKKSFSAKGDIREHMTTHIDDRPFSCSVCNKTFSRKTSMVCHMRIHTGEQPYSCDVCKKSFAYRKTLIIHIRTHTGERPHTCTICNRSYSHKYDLNLHFQTHTGNCRFACEICNKPFTRLNHLDSHMRSHETCNLYPFNMYRKNTNSTETCVDIVANPSPGRL